MGTFDEVLLDLLENEIEKVDTAFPGEKNEVYLTLDERPDMIITISAQTIEEFEKHHKEKLH